nr:MAG TPA: hypothetical protein [Crassvirales sp.]
MEMRHYINYLLLLSLLKCIYRYIVLLLLIIPPRLAKQWHFKEFNLFVFFFSFSYLYLIELFSIHHSHT